VIDIVLNLVIDIVLNLVIDIVLNLVIDIVLNLVIDIVLNLEIGIVLNLEIGIVLNLVIDIVLNLVIGIVLNIIGIVCFYAMRRYDGDFIRMCPERATVYVVDFFDLCFNVEHRWVVSDDAATACRVEFVNIVVNAHVSAELQNVLDNAIFCFAIILIHYIVMDEGVEIVEVRKKHGFVGFV
jgi:hypothetical protein